MLKRIGLGRKAILYETRVDNWGSRLYCTIIVQQETEAVSMHCHTLSNTPKETGKIETSLQICLNQDGYVTSLGLDLSAPPVAATSEEVLHTEVSMETPQFDLAEFVPEGRLEEVCLDFTVKWLPDDRLECAVYGRLQASDLRFQLSPEAVLCTQENGDFTGVILGPFQPMDRYVIDQLSPRYDFDPPPK